MAGPLAQDALQELSDLLQSMQALKPPGANKSKIDAITKICTAHQNTQRQIAIVDILFDAFNRSSNTHKLGVMYIVDTVTRQWIAGGTDWASGVKKITDLLHPRMTELIMTAPENQKEKISKLIDIWVTCRTFPPNLLKKYKQQLANSPAPNKSMEFTQGILPAQSSAVSADPAPPNGAVDPAPVQAVIPAPAPSNLQVAPQQHPSYQNTGGAVPLASNVGSNPLLVALANMPQQQLAQVAQMQALLGSQPPIPYANGHNGQQVSAAMPAVTFPSVAVAPPLSQAPQVPLNTNVTAPPTNAPSLANSLAFLLNQAGTSSPNTPPAQLEVLLQQFIRNLSTEQAAGVFAALSGGNYQAPVPPPGVVPPPLPPPPPFGQEFGTSQQNVPPVAPFGQESRHDLPDLDSMPRSRSRSPDFNKRRRHSPPDRRASPSYAAYDPSGANNEYSQAADYGRRGGRGRNRGNRNDRNDYRRTPPQAQRNRPVSPKQMARNTAPKPIDFEPTLDAGFIKVLSRTLFVGGVRTSENELKQFFSRFGPVQSCIVNHDKRHAFLKTFSHQDCVATKAAVENLPPDAYRGLFERIGWAVGFGPTEYADYSNGTSALPIMVLTDADRKWVLTAEYGGTGGRELHTGMVIEEPDIEIGAGPSSKGIAKARQSKQPLPDDLTRNTAISRRGGGGQGQRGGGHFNHNNHNHNHNHNNHNNNNRRGNFRHDPYRKPDRPEPKQTQNPSMPEPNHIGPPPPVPIFGAPIPGFPMNFR